MFYTEMGWFNLNSVIKSFVDTNLDIQVLELHTNDWGLAAAVKDSQGQVELRAWVLKYEDNRYYAKTVNFSDDTCLNYTKGVPKSLLNKLSPPFGNTEARYRSIAALINN